MLLGEFDWKPYGTESRQVALSRPGLSSLPMNCPTALKAGKWHDISSLPSAQLETSQPQAGRIRLAPATVLLPLPSPPLPLSCTAMSGVP